MEFWGLNRLHQVLPNRMGKFDRWFEIHSLQRFYLDTKDEAHAEILHDFKGPVYVRPDDMGLMSIPNEVPFPIGTLLDVYPDYFTNSVSWLIALANLMLADAAQEYQDSQRFGDGTVPAPELHVYGVDMAQDTLQTAEYAEQRPSCEYFLGAASAMGIQVIIPEGADLLKTSHRYGFDDTDPIRGKDTARLEELGGRKNQLQTQLDTGDKERAKLVAGINQLDGAMQQLQYGMRNLMPSQEESPVVTAPEITLDVLAGAIANIQGTLAALTAEQGED